MVQAGSCFPGIFSGLLSTERGDQRLEPHIAECHSMGRSDLPFSEKAHHDSNH